MRCVEHVTLAGDRGGVYRFVGGISEEEKDRFKTSA
jgi:hypothetical protein